MADSDSSNPSFSSGRRWLSALNTGLAAVIALALVVMANYLSGGHYLRAFWSRDAPFKLSQQSLAILNSMTNVVQVTMFFDPNGDNEQIYGLTRSLLTEYQDANPKHVHVNLLDYTRNVGDARELLSKHNLNGAKDKDFVLFECNNHYRIVFASDMADYDFSDLLTGRSKYVRRSAFRGEQLFTGDIYDVCNPQSLKSYFLYGHGENDPGNPNAQPQDLGNTGCSKLAAILKQDVNSDWARLSLLGTNSIPADCQLLIVAGPEKGDFRPEEVAKIGDYLQKGGRLLALLTKPCGLDKLLAEHWGVRLGNNRVVDVDPNYQESPYTFMTAHYIAHPVINPLAKEEMGILMVWPRAIYSVEDQHKVPGAPEVNMLAATTTNATDSEHHTEMFYLMAAVEQGVIQGVDSPRGGGTRIVVVGDADFLDDQVIDKWGGNQEFARLAMNWLLQRPPILIQSIIPQPIREYKLYIPPAKRLIVRWLFLVGMPAAVLFLGMLVWLRRRR